MWGSNQVLPNQVDKKCFYTFEDIDLRESDAKFHKKTSKTVGPDPREGGGHTSISLTGMLVREQISTTQKIE